MNLGGGTSSGTLKVRCGLGACGCLVWRLVPTGGCLCGGLSPLVDACVAACLVPTSPARFLKEQSPAATIIHFVPVNSLAIAGTSEKWREMVAKASEIRVNLNMRGRSSRDAGGRRKLSIVGMERTAVVKVFLQVGEDQIPAARPSTRPPGVRHSEGRVGW